MRALGHALVDPRVFRGHSIRRQSLASANIAVDRAAQRLEVAAVVHAAPRGRVGFEVELSQHLGRESEADEQSDVRAVPIDK